MTHVSHGPRGGSGKQGGRALRDKEVKVETLGFWNFKGSHLAVNSTVRFPLRSDPITGDPVNVGDGKKGTVERVHFFKGEGWCYDVVEEDGITKIEKVPREQITGVQKPGLFGISKPVRSKSVGLRQLIFQIVFFSKKMREKKVPKIEILGEN